MSRGNGRVRKALTALGLVERLGNTQTYEYTPRQAAHVIAVLDAAMERIEKAFGLSQEEPEEAFALPEHDEAVVEAVVEVVEVAEAG